MTVYDRIASTSARQQILNKLADTLDVLAEVEKAYPKTPENRRQIQNARMAVTLCAAIDIRKLEAAA